VALTRAKKQLYISYANYTNEGKQLEATLFLAEIQMEHNLPREAVRHTDDQLTDFSILQFRKNVAPEVAHLDDGLVDRLVQNFSMSVSALNSYLKCPLGFYYQTIVRIPSPRNEAMEFGSAVHHALEGLFTKMKKTEEFPLLDDFLQDFTWYMKRHRESFTREQFARRLEYGLEILKNYYNTYVTKWNKVVVVELGIRNVVLDEIPLRGFIDKVEFNGKEATLIDYKTGDPEKCTDKFARPGKEPNGGDYWRQAVFYKILLDLYPKNWNVTGIEFDFIEPDKKKQYRKEKVTVSSIDIDLVKQQIKEVWLKIQRKDFYTGCGKDDCHWCNFVKTNKLHIALHELNEEEEKSKGFMKLV
jgi:DNA helicase-2/ATP-dependent DNA helicase PcrA